MGRTVVAHAGQPLSPERFATAWSFEPLIVAVLVAGVALYGAGLRRVRSTEAGRRALPPWRSRCFAAAVTVAAVALLSPLEALAHELFGAHMLQHVLLTLVVPPLLVLARPVLVGSMGLPLRARRTLSVARVRLPQPGTRPVGFAVAAVVVHVTTLWVWHVPALYEAALDHAIVHVVEHTTLIAGALPLWWVAAEPRGRYANAVGVAALFAGVFQSGVLVRLVTFAGEAWYPHHIVGALRWGLTPLEDQQLAGGLMLFPGGLAYLIGGVLLFLRWLRADERAAVLYGRI